MGFGVYLQRPGSQEPLLDLPSQNRLRPLVTRERPGFVFRGCRVSTRPWEELDCGLFSSIDMSLAISFL